MTTLIPRLECSSATTGCHPVVYYMLGIVSVFFFMSLVSEYPTLWTLLWCFSCFYFWLCCNTTICIALYIRKIFISYYIRNLSITILHTENINVVIADDFHATCTSFTTSINVVHRRTAWSTTTINGNNGEWTNTDDLDNAARVRMHREANNRRHAVNPNIGNRGRVQYGPPRLPLPRPAGVVPPPDDISDISSVDSDPEPPKVDIKEMQVTIYSRGAAHISGGILARFLAALWLVTKIMSYCSLLGVIIYKMHTTRDPMYTLFLTATVVAGCCYVLRKKATDYFVGSARDDLQTWYTTEVALIGTTNIGERTHAYLPGLNYNEKYVETASMLFLETLRRKHPGINCHAEMVNICLNTIQHVHPDEYTEYYQIANNTALYYYQERMRYSIRANRVVVNGRNLLGSA